MDTTLISPKIDLGSNTGRCCAIDPVTSMDESAAHSWAGIFKALGHPVRVQMLDILSRHGGQACVCDLESQFDLSQPTISHHLKVLRQAGLLITEQRGQWIFYRVQPTIVEDLSNFLAGLK